MSRSLARAVGSGVDRLVLFLLRKYQHIGSPIFAALGSRCRFEPSCSQYMIDAVSSRGAVVGVGLGLWRLLRCSPFTRGGYDPAPSGRQSSLEPDRATDQDVSRETI